MKIYHGSKDIIKSPIYGGGNKNNDYGKGFYTTEHFDLAAEWAVEENRSGYVNEYTIDTSDLKILNLNNNEFNILNWLTILINNRLFKINSPIQKQGSKYLRDNFNINTNGYDIIIGYRADDSYYDFAESFLNNIINLEQLSKAMNLGKLGEQVFIKSEYAFSKIKYVKSTPVNKTKYYPLKKKRFDDAFIDYINLSTLDVEGLYLIDIIRKKIKNNDPRIK